MWPFHITNTAQVFYSGHGEGKGECGCGGMVLISFQPKPKVLFSPAAPF